MKLFGPLHAYVAPVTDVFNVNVEPAQTGPVFVGAGVAGIGLTVAIVVPIALVQPLSVTVNE